MSQSTATPSEDWIGKALTLAAKAHRDQMRKGCDVPYIVHPVEVSRTLRSHGLDESHDRLHAAALLHDVVEDTDVTLDDLCQEFPEDIVEWVSACSEVKFDTDKQKLPWKFRKLEHLNRLADSPWQAAAIVLADKIHNLQDIVRDHESIDWTIFSAPPTELLWYYRAAVEASQRPNCTEALAAAATTLVDQLEAIVNSNDDVT